MKIVLLVAGSRGGSDFFQSLLDGHDQISQLPGLLRYDKQFSELLNSKKIENIPKEFIKIYPHYFDSRITKNNFIERHNQLGKNCNKYYLVNKKKFEINFIKLAKKKEKSRSNNLIFLHLSYSKACNEIIKKKKILVINIHLVAWATYLVRDLQYKNIDIIHTLRHPLSAVSSSVKNWLRYKNGKFFDFASLYHQLDLILNGIDDLMKLKKKIKIIQLEKIHRENLIIMKEFCKIYKIKFISILTKSTFQKKLWWGDKVSSKYLNGVNKNFKISHDQNIFFNRDLVIFKNLFSNIAKFYNYTLQADKKGVNLNLYVPLKIELLVLLNLVKNFKLISILKVPYFFIKRITLFKKRRKKKQFPYSLGSVKLIN